jgi:hypothetical protein
MSNPYIQVTWQAGPVPEVGVNGAQIEDVITAALRRLSELNSKLPCRENASAISSLQFALDALAIRTEKRRAQGVEGTDQPHRGA